MPPPTTTTIPSVAYSNVMANGCNIKISTTNDSSVTITQTTTTTGNHNMNTVTNEMLTKTSRALTSDMGTSTSIHNSDAIASSQLDQHGELQYTSSTGTSLQPAIVEAFDAHESFDNKIPVTSTDGNNMQHIKQPQQSTHTAYMTVNGATEDVMTKSLTEDNSQYISSTNSESDSEHPETPPIVQSQQNNIMEG